MNTLANTYTAFAEHQRVGAGPIETVALAVQDWENRGGVQALIFEDQTGQQIDLDLRGTPNEALERLRQHPWFATSLNQDEQKTGPGRPKLGVVSREVSLLPRQWDWLNAQRGGASASLRKLVDEQIKSGQGAQNARRSWEALSKFMWAMAGNLPAFEEASRAITRREYDHLSLILESWPPDIRDHVRTLIAVAREDEE
jgi:hypothetical protein